MGENPPVLERLRELRRRVRSAGDPDRPTSVPAAVAVFAAAGLAAVVLVGVGAAAILRSTTEREAIRHAKELTRLGGEGIVGPSITPALLRGSAHARARLDRTVRAHVLRDPVVRVKLWRPDGGIVYSDEPRLVGRRFPLRGEERTALRDGVVEAEASDLTRPENRFERGRSRLLEVYLPLRTAGGRSLLYEEYLRFAAVAESGRRQWLALSPALIGALIVLELAQIPLAWSLAARLRRRQEEREALLQGAIESSDRERRRIARGLHDGVVQDLAGVSYTLDAAGDGLGRGDAAAARDAVREAAGATRGSIRSLRALLVDLHPPSLAREGLAAAVGDLAAALGARGVVEVDVRIPAETGLDPATETLLFQAAREGLRNVAKHAGATSVAVSLARENGHATLAVADDGRGFDPGAPAAAGGEHLGLGLLADLAGEAGGRLEVDSRPGRGTRVAIEVPAS